MCLITKGYVRDSSGNCRCPSGYAIDIYDECTPCRIEKGYRIDETGRCVCALERGMVIDERGRCVCPIQYGYTLTELGECILEPRTPSECQRNEDCADNRYCNLVTRTCEDPCKTCGVNAFCNATNHQAKCICKVGFSGNPDIQCGKIK